ncbi:MAG: glutamine amidotransferase [Acidobacteriota bacterium]|nr:glutamine amidotransferase [Acidobacteriota bacterium]
MRFAAPVPWWLGLCLVLVAIGVTWATYPRLVPLSRVRRGLLFGLRLTVFLLILLLLAQPVRDEPVAAARGLVVVLVDQSRSMAIADVAGVRRIDAGRALIRDTLIPALTDQLQVDVWGFGDELEPLEDLTKEPEDRQSDLSGAVRQLRERYANESVSAIVVVSDGGDTSGAEPVVDEQPPIFALGLGAPVIARDREIRDLYADQPGVAASLVELAVSTVTHGLGLEPFDLQVFEDSQLVRVIPVVPRGDGIVTQTVVAVSPRPDRPVVYSVEIAHDPRELVAGNNTRRVLVEPPGRVRRVLLIEGGPGYEHSFLKRTLRDDPGFVVDAVIEKGLNDRGERTFYVQADEARAQTLLTGYPEREEDLFDYDVVVLGNVDPQRLRPAHLELTAAFVSERGGGLLVMGARSFGDGGLRDTPLESVLPLELSPRGLSTVSTETASRAPQPITVTPVGERHPIMRLGPTPDHTRERWNAAPPLGDIARMGAPRPAAAVLAVGGDASGDAPVVAVHRFGRGRAMVFAGEASWRWQMLAPASDDTYERFWKQTLRWLAADAPDPVMVRAWGGQVAGDPVQVEIVVADDTFEPIAGATVQVVVQEPGRETETHTAIPVAGKPGHYRLEVSSNTAGVYNVRVTGYDEETSLGVAETAVLVGGAERELIDPRRHDAVLRRMARASGGQLVEPNAIEQLIAGLRENVDPEPPPVARDLWDSVWVMVALIALLVSEWGLRRRWGLR